MSESCDLHEHFEFYKSYYENNLMSNDQLERLKILHKSRDEWGITLSQCDNWMIKAGVIKKKVLSLSETGIIFSKFK
jgi:hypothetical protein